MAAINHVDINLILGIINGAIGLWAAYVSRRNSKDIAGVAGVAMTGLDDNGKPIIGTNKAKDRPPVKAAP